MPEFPRKAQRTRSLSAKKRKAFERKQFNDRQMLKRKDLLEQHKKSTASKQHMGLFKSSSKLGQKFTRSEEKTMADRLVKANVPLTDDMKESLTVKPSRKHTAVFFEEEKEEVNNQDFEENLISDDEDFSDEDKENEASTPAAADIPKHQDMEEVVLPETKKKYTHRFVERTEEMTQHRMRLPVMEHESTIVDAVRHNDVVVVVAQTGSGKTTQIPQILYENGFCGDDILDKTATKGNLIAVTQPRRLAAISSASRVSEEMGITVGEGIGYMTRFDTKINEDKSLVRFMTDGLLLKILERDPCLQDYAVLVLDEVHERNANVDLIIGIASRINMMRARSSLKLEPLKIILMSATLDTTELVDSDIWAEKPRLLEIEGRMYPVTLRFARKTVGIKETASKEIVRRCGMIHGTRPEGNILVFLDSKREIMRTCRALCEHFGLEEEGAQEVEKTESEDYAVDIDTAVEEKDQKTDKMETVKDAAKEAAEKEAAEKEEQQKEKALDDDLEKQLNDKKDNLTWDDFDEYLEHEEEEEVRILEGNVEFDADEADPAPATDLKVKVFPLYASLEPEMQARIFKEYEGTRLIIVATNVAETSLTLPNIRYIVDSGRKKVKLYEGTARLERFETQWTSQAAAKQRAGRAGRVCAGECWRLYSSAVFESQFAEYDEPEIVRIPLDTLLLRVLKMGVRADSIASFPFLVRPEQERIRASLMTLRRFHFLSGDTLSPLAHTNLPIHPRFVFMLSYCLQHCEELAPAILVLISAVSHTYLVGDLLAKINEDEYVEITNSVKSLTSAKSDFSAIIAILGAYLFDGTNFYNLNSKSLNEFRQVLYQLRRVSGIRTHLQPLSKTQFKELRKVFLYGFKDQIGVLRGMGKKWYLSSSIRDEVRITANSFVRSPYPKLIVFLNQYTVLDEITELPSYRFSCVSEIKEEWLNHVVLDEEMCSYSPPLRTPPPHVEEEQIMVGVRPQFRLNPDIKLPAIHRPLTRYDSQFVKYFVYCLLNGDIFPQLKEFARSLRFSVANLLKPDYNVPSTVQPLLRTIKLTKIYSIGDLCKHMIAKQGFLIDQLSKCYSNRAVENAIRAFRSIRDE
ncbi:hypothetical protein PCE1_003691 [Barthelona sp. PCE]